MMMANQATSSMCLLNIESSLAIYTVNKIGEITPPCHTPFTPLNVSDAEFQEYYRSATGIKHNLYIVFWYLSTLAVICPVLDL